MLISPTTCSCCAQPLEPDFGSHEAVPSQIARDAAWGESDEANRFYCRSGLVGPVWFRVRGPPQRRSSYGVRCLGHLSVEAGIEHVPRANRADCEREVRDLSIAEVLPHCVEFGIAGSALGYRVDGLRPGERRALDFAEEAHRLAPAGHGIDMARVHA